MDRYAFGNWLMTLRQQAGFSQFQLGMLLGVTDKAISKWETGTAMPKMPTCEKLATIYHISINKLMSCGRDEHMLDIDDAVQMLTEAVLWQEARQRLSDIYGRKPPDFVLARFRAEETLFRNTGIIEHLKLIDRLDQLGLMFDREDDITMGTLIGWLFRSTPFNPLPAHTRCPACHSISYHPESKDGWDLPDELCACGTKLIRDGHNIGLDWHQSDLSKSKHDLRLKMCLDDEHILRQTIEELYQGRWLLVEYLTKTDQTLREAKLTPFDKTFAIIPFKNMPVYPKIGDVYQVPAEMNETQPFLAEQNSILYVRLTERDQIQRSIWPLSWQIIKDDMLVTTGVLECVFRRVNNQNWQGRYFGIVPGIDMDYHTYPDKRCLPEQHSFSDLVHFFALFSIGDRCRGFIQQQIFQKEARLSDVPLTVEDFFSYLLAKQEEEGLNDNGLTEILFTQIPAVQTPMLVADELKRTLDQIGCPEWFAGYAESVEYLPRKADLLQLVTYMVQDEYHDSNEDHLG